MNPAAFFGPPRQLGGRASVGINVRLIDENQRELTPVLQFPMV